MKKPLVILIALIAVAIASYLWVRSQMGISDPLELVPNEAAAFIALPDLARTAMRWPQTALAKIGAEPDVKAFFEKPRAFLDGRPAARETAALVADLRPGRAYIALLPSEKAGFRALVGVQYWGSKGAFDKAVERLRRQLAGDEAGEVTRESVQGVEVSSGAAGRGETIFWASKGRWGFLANERDAVVRALDLAAGKPGSIADAADLAKTMSRLPAEADLVGFVRPGPVVDVLLRAGDQFGMVPDEKQIERLRKVQAGGYALELDGASMREAVFVDRPEPPDMGALAHLGMPFTSASTLAYFDFSVQVGDIAAALAASPLAQALPGDVGAELFAKVPEALDGRASLLAAWPNDTIRPRALLALGVKDAALASDLVLKASRALPEVVGTQRDNAKVFSFPTLNSPFISPAIALGDGVLLGALDATELDEALSGNRSSPTLEASPAFAPALPAYRSANETFGFLDARGIFERVYPVLRQILVFAGAFAPGASEMIDPSKAPETNVVAKHLGPIVFSQTRLPEGYLLESTGPLTMMQVLALTGGAGSGFLVPHLRSR